MSLLYAFVALVVFIAAMMAADNVRVRRLRLKRQGQAEYGREHFIESFRPLEIPEAIPANVYDYYESAERRRGFPLSPSDGYYRELAMAEDDMPDEMKALAERLKLRIPPEYICRERGGRPVETLHDMVLWLDWVRQHQPGAEGVWTVPRFAR